MHWSVMSLMTLLFLNCTLTCIVSDINFMRVCMIKIPSHCHSTAGCTCSPPRHRSLETGLIPIMYYGMRNYRKTRLCMVRLELATSRTQDRLYRWLLDHFHPWNSNSIVDGVTGVAAMSNPIFDKNVWNSIDFSARLEVNILIFCATPNFNGQYM